MSNLTRRIPGGGVRRRALRGGAGVVILGALVGLFGASWPAFAQETGTVTGRVVAARTGVPLGSVQIYLVGTAVGTLSADNGRYILLNVTPGTYQLRAERIGYRTVTQEVTVRAGQSEVMNFGLEEEVLGLDEIVVTGEAGAARRREVGNTITQLKLAEIPEPAPALEALLQARAPSLVITESGGYAGAGSMIRIRGNHSVAMSNQPLVYVDGIRIRSDAYPKNVPPTGYSGRSVNVQASPLNDIDPNTIERIEIIKGAAATALYGTEASAGVIQIFTKKGTQGRARWTLQVDQGFGHLRPFGPDSDPYMRLDPWLRGAPSLLSPGYKEKAEERSAADDKFDPNRLYTYPGTAYRQKYHVSARGGVGDLNYYVSGTWEDYLGILPNDSEEKLNVRGNFGFSPLRNVQLQWNTSVTSSLISNTASGNNAHGITLNTYRGDVNYVGGYSYELVNQILNQRIDTEIDHLITGATVTYSPSVRFSNRLAVGWDRSAVELRQLRPFGFRLAPRGILSSRKWVGETLTFDYAGNYALDLGANLGLTLSWGGQAWETETTSVWGEAQNFPGPGEPTLSSGGLTLSFEDRVRVINAGFFGQTRLDWRDRLFLTAGLRVDGNSAFGEGLGLQPYPKVSVSYVISDEPFWRESWGSVKLRAAVGESGRAPGAFDAIRTWNPTRLGTSPGYLPRNPGNPELGPERTREYEVGFEASVLQNRLTAEFTYYYQRTYEALFPVRPIPSLGDWNAQLRNVGTMENRGLELVLNGTAIQRENLTWDLGVSLFTNRSKVLDLGEAVEFAVGGDAYIIEGQPVPVVRGRRIVNAGELAAPVVEDDYIFGPNQPTITVIPTTRIRLPGEIVVSARAEYLGGFYMTNGPWEAAIGRSVPWPTCGDYVARIGKGDVADIPAEFRARCNPRFPKLAGLFIFPADFFKVRDITVQFPLSRFVPWGESPTLTLSARNWIRWYNSEWLEFDPEMVTNAGHDVLYRAMTEHVPPPAVFTASLRVNF